MQNIKHWRKAFGIPNDEKLSGLASLNQIIMKLNDFDTSNTPNNSLLLKKIEQNKAIYEKEDENG